jgi:transcription elongation GreA/GreB family factor
MNANATASIRNAASSKTATSREFAIGDTVTVRFMTEGGDWGPMKTYQLASENNLKSNPIKIGPESPLHKALIGRQIDTEIVETTVQTKIERVS